MVAVFLNLPVSIALWFLTFNGHKYSFNKLSGNIMNFRTDKIKLALLITAKFRPDAFIDVIW